MKRRDFLKLVRAGAMAAILPLPIVHKGGIIDVVKINGILNQGKKAFSRLTTTFEEAEKLCWEFQVQALNVKTFVCKIGGHEFEIAEAVSG